MLKNKSRQANIKIYIIPFIIITIIFVFIMFTMRNSIRNYFYDLKKEEALKTAKGISLDLSHTGVAVDTINQLLEEKLINILQVADLHREDYSDDFLIQLANIFDIDEVYSYNSEGIIEHSSSGKYIGWKAYEGHPVYDFMTGNETMLIEDIRPDSESQIYYKYGYIKHPDGFFLQIGILADKVYKILESFMLQHHLEEMAADGAIVQLCALNQDFVITGCSNEDMIGYQIKDETIISQLNKGNIHDRINLSNGEDLYEILVPLEHETEKVIAIGIQYSLNEIVPVIRKNTFIGITGLIIVYISLLLSIYSTYKRDKKLVELAYYDNLTGLPNTESLRQRLSEDLTRSKNNKAILMIECDNLNLINLTFGYEYGDKVLKEMGNRIKTLVCKNTQLFRFSSDRLVLYVKDYEKREELLDLIMKVKDLLNQSFTINGISKNPAIKIGVKEFNGKSANFDQILKDATIALKYADDSTTYSYSFFDENMESDIQREEIIERELRDAIREKDISKIYLLYQPIMDSKTNKIDGFEALARMNSEKFGFVSPVEFIDIAERKQLIIPLSNYILNLACKFIANLTKIGFNDIRVAVNISTIHILQEDFVTTVLNIIDEAGINGHNLELELTETIMMENFEIVNERLKELRAHGIQISLDDFGTGYSSFDRLSELYVDTLKIDKYFIDNIVVNHKDSLITKDLISIAHRFGLKTVAEGVEFNSQKDYLLEYDCDKLQGYLFSKPVPQEEAIEILKMYN